MSTELDDTSTIVPNTSGSTIVVSTNTPNSTVVPNVSGSTVVVSTSTPSSTVVPNASGGTVVVSTSTPSSTVVPNAFGGTIVVSTDTPNSTVVPDASGGTVVVSTSTPSSTVVPNASGGTIVVSTDTPNSTVVPNASGGTVVVSTDTPNSTVVPNASGSTIVVSTDTPNSTVVPNVSGSTIVVSTNTPNSTVVPNVSGSTVVVSTDTPNSTVIPSLMEPPTAPPNTHAARNPHKPIIPSRVRYRGKRNADAVVLLKRKAKAGKLRSLAEDVHEVRKGIEDMLPEMAARHGVTKKEMRRRIFNGAGLKHKRNPSSYNAKVRVVSIGSRIGMIEAKAMIKEDCSLLNDLDPEDVEEAIKELEEECKLMKDGVRGDNIKAALDVKHTLDHVQDQMDLLADRSGIIGFACFAPTDHHDAAQTRTLQSHGALKFVPEVLNRDQRRFCSMYELWAIQRGPSGSVQAVSIPEMRVISAGLLKDNLIDVLGRSNIAINYENYLRVMVYGKGVMIVGWPEGVPWKRMAQQSVSEDVRLVYHALRDRTCFWKRATPTEQAEEEKRFKKVIKAGLAPSPTERQSRSDLGGKHRTVQPRAPRSDRGQARNDDEEEEEQEEEEEEEPTPPTRTNPPRNKSRRVNEDETDDGDDDEDEDDEEKSSSEEEDVVPGKGKGKGKSSSTAATSKSSASKLFAAKIAASKFTTKARKLPPAARALAESKRTLSGQSVKKSAVGKAGAGKKGGASKASGSKVSTAGGKRKRASEGANDDESTVPKKRKTGGEVAEEPRQKENIPPPKVIVPRPAWNNVSGRGVRSNTVRSRGGGPPGRRIVSA
ncbi:hypothetical protein FB45DRAFT_1041455 [Roridomyces roridus]|uniref:Uncharacterized protein n=1 Tax=Roridomyces roridus TaxID=1738132 RepID=A0AAD7B050_9AGAR|nr:hypothetical protein FB45DRAFT_1041455 [Roridomyces roridus]